MHSYMKLCLNPTVQKDSRGVLGTSFRLEKYSEILGSSNMADFMPSVITYLREQAVNNKRSMFLFIFPRLEYRIKSTALNYFQCFKPRTFREFLDCQIPFAIILHAHDML